MPQRGRGRGKSTRVRGRKSPRKIPKLSPQAPVPPDEEVRTEDELTPRLRPTDTSKSVQSGSDEDSLNLHQNQESSQEEQLKPSAKTRSEKRDCTIRDTQIENETVLCFRENPCLWDMKHEDFKNKDKRQSLLEAKPAEIGLKNVEELKTWFKSLRDQYTRLKRRKSGDGLPEPTARETWVLEKFSFFKQRVLHKPEPLKSLKALINEKRGDLGAVEAAAAAQGVMVDDDDNTMNEPPKTSTHRKQPKELPLQSTEVAELHSYLTQKATESTNLVKLIESKITTPEKHSVRTGFAHYVKSVLTDLSESDFKKARKQINRVLDQFLDKSSDEDDMPTMTKPRSQAFRQTADDDDQTLGAFGNQKSSHTTQSEAWQPNPQYWHQNPPTGSVWGSQDPAYMQQYHGNRQQSPMIMTNNPVRDSVMKTQKTYNYGQQPLQLRSPNRSRPVRNSLAGTIINKFLPCLECARNGARKFSWRNRCQSEPEHFGRYRGT